VLGALALAVGGGASLVSVASGDGPKVVGHAYTETNDPAGNKLIVFDRLSDGTLKQRQIVDTGGRGGQQLQPGCTPKCPILDTQGEVVSTPDEHLLFAVNAGSNTITSFRQSPWGFFKVGEISSGGAFPNSLTVHGNTLYVLNSNSGTIKGFKFSWFGDMSAISGSTQPVPANPPPQSGANARQIGFDNTGRVLAVSTLGSSKIDTFKVDGSGHAGPATPPTTSRNPLPFGFAFDPKNRLVMSEVTDLMGAGNTSTYNLNTNTASLSPKNSQPSNGAAPCWVVVTNDGKYAFVVNTGGGQPATIARYAINNDGSLAGLSPNTDPNGKEFARTDEDLSRDSQFLYVLSPALMAPASKIDAYKVGSDGSLTLVGATPAKLPPGISGLVVH
jgi:6-phosphogluconolactonase (cycloisomerase 2 family)